MNWITLAFVIAGDFAAGLLIGWLLGDDHGRNKTNREWYAQRHKPPMQFPKIIGDNKR